MLHSTIKMTRFEVEKLAPVRADSRAVPYLINTFKGRSLGSIGHIAESHLPAGNDPNLSARTGLKRLLTMRVW